jgi:small subunit ribosomal protein S17e
MGRIKTSFIKHIGKDLFEKYSDMFTPDFDKNKESVKELINVKSKSTRNILVGYLTILAKRSKK